MSAANHTDPIKKKIDSHPVKLAIGIAIGAVALIVGIILLVQLAIGLYASRTPKDDPAMTPQKVAERLRPVATVEIDPNASATPAPAAPVAVAASAPAAAPKGTPAGSGKATYDSVCGVCHAAGVAGAPKFGDKAAWAPRVKGGKDALYASATKGKGAMPPKGGNPSLTDADMKAAVDYMVGAAK
jgi:cytochrome c5